MKLLFIVFILLVWVILFSMHYLVYTTISRVFSVSLPYWYYVLGLLSLSYLLASIGVRTMNHILFDSMYVVASSWLGILFLLFSVVLIYVVVHLITGNDSQILLSALLILALLLSAYALVQGRSIVTKSYTITLDTIKEPIRIAHISDIHVGTVHQKKYLETVVEKTNALHPDIVLITGDLFDGSAPIDKEILTPLNNLKAKSFFSNGNHEMYEGLDMVRETLEGLDVQLMENTRLEYKGLEIIGINDTQSLPRGENLESILNTFTLATNTPRLLMYHTPVDWDVAKKYDVDVMFSGHTHNGQVFPFILLVKLFFSKTSGLYEDEGKYLHVSPGTGTWGPPMRLGSKNQITLFKFVPKTEK